ncbi:MAG: ATP-binding protein [Candidatus Marsarchaeota archaeon]|nr:ATP-binding protein [Candidatus Marsarchaeota archaeon]
MDLKSIIKEQRWELENIQKTEHIILREGLQEAESYLAHPNVLVITGIRRCGKSIFSYLIEKTHKFGYINFDDERLFGIESKDLDSILQAIYELYGTLDYLVLDEIQNVSNWELFVNRLRRTMRVILTGSNSNLLSSELATHITGRYIEKRLFPFSFKEYLIFNKFSISNAYTTVEKALINKMLDNYLVNGGMPETYKFGKQILLRTYDDIITKDVVVRRKVKKSNELKKLAKYLITNVAEEFSYRALGSATEIKNVSTVTKWVSYLEECFLIFKLERFDFKLKQQFIAPKKIYCVDPGLVELIGFKFSENKGRVIENVVAIQLQRKKEKIIDLEVYYWKDHSQKEVDFVLKSKSVITELIQVSAISRIDELKEREINALLAASAKLKCNTLTIITMNLDDVIKIREKKITLIPLWKYLLE